MEEQIKQIFKSLSESKDSERPREVLEFLDSLYQDPKFFQALFNIFHDKKETYTNRVMAIIVLKQQLKSHWRGFSKEFQQVFLDNIPNLIVGITTQEPDYHLLISDFIKTLLYVSFEAYFNEYWSEVIATFIDSDEDHFFSGILILSNVFQVIDKRKYINEPSFKTEFKPFIIHHFEKITSFYDEAVISPFLKMQLINVATSVVGIEPEIIFESSFSPWFETVESLISSELNFILPYTKETAKFMSSLVKFFYACQKISTDEIPYINELFFLCFSIMHDPSWEDNSNESLIVNTFNFFSYFSSARMKNFPSWKENFLPKINEIIQNVFLPEFLLPPSALQLAISDPVEFINEYHVDIDEGQTTDANSNEESEEEDSESFLFDKEESYTPIVAAFNCLRQMSEKHTEIHDFLLSIAATALTEFLSSEEKDFLLLYSVFHMVHAFWGNIVLYEDENKDDDDEEENSKDGPIEFMNQLLPLFQESVENPSALCSDKACIYIFQSTLFLIISLANPITKKVNHGDDDSIYYVNPDFVEVSIAFLDSDSSLVQYFATFSVYHLLDHFNSSRYEKDVMKVCQPHAIKIIGNIIDYAQKYGKTKIANIISTFLKDNDILKNFIKDTPDFIENVFSIAASNVENNFNSSNDLSPLFNTLLNLIDQLDKNPQEQEFLCTMIFKKCIESFSTFKYYLAFYELVAIILSKSPEYIHDLYNLILQPIVSNIPNIFSANCEIGMNVALIFHNMMIRSPEFMFEMNNKSIKNITGEESESVSNPNSLFEIESIIEDNDTVTQNIYNSALLFLFPIDQFPNGYFENIMNEFNFENEDSLLDTLNYGYDSCVDMLLLILKINPQMFIDRDDGNLLYMFLEYLNCIDIACTLSFIGQYIPLQKRNDYLMDIISKSIGNDEDDPFDSEFKNDTNNVTTYNKYFLIFSYQKKLEIIQEYLKKLVDDEPGFIDMFGENKQNLTNLLEYKIQ